MKRTVSVIVRRASGKLEVIYDRARIDCDDDHAGLEQLLEKYKGIGAQSVLILLEDDSVARHWVRSSEVLDTPGAAERSEGRKKKPTKKRK